jgi:hypothetical protein
MSKGKPVTIAEHDFASIREATEYATAIRNRAWSTNKKIIGGFAEKHAPITDEDDHEFLKALVVFHPEWKAKRKEVGRKVSGFAVALDKKYGRNRCLYLSTKQNPTAVVISLSSCIKALAEAQATEAEEEHGGEGGIRTHGTR